MAGSKYYDADSGRTEGAEDDSLTGGACLAVALAKAGESRRAPGRAAARRDRRPSRGRRTSGSSCALRPSARARPARAPASHTTNAVVALRRSAPAARADERQALDRRRPVSSSASARCVQMLTTSVCDASNDTGSSSAIASAGLPSASAASASDGTLALRRLRVRCRCSSELSLDRLRHQLAGAPPRPCAIAATTMRSSKACSARMPSSSASSTRAFAWSISPTSASLIASCRCRCRRSAAG